MFTNNQISLYKEASDNWQTCIIPANTNPYTLVWNLERKDRIIQIINTESDWKIQLDDRLPVSIKNGDSFYISANIYCRFIKGKGELKFKVKFQ